MGEYKDMGIAIQDLDFMIDSIQTAMNGKFRKDRKKGFDNRQVIFMIKAWYKVQIRSEIGGGTPPAYWFSRNEPAKLVGSQKRSEVLVRALEDYQRTLERDGDRSSYYYRANDAMLNFVWDYHQHIVDDVDRETEFINSVKQAMFRSLDNFMKDAIFPGEQSI